MDLKEELIKTISEKLKKKIRNNIKRSRIQRRRFRKRYRRINSNSIFFIRTRRII